MHHIAQNLLGCTAVFLILSYILAAVRTWNLTFLHHLCTCSVITLAPYNVTSSWWISTGGTTHFFFCPLFQYGCHLETTAVSVHVIWGGNYYCYLVVNICTNWTHTCQLNAGILSAGIK
jgi:hypothetical protein